MLDLIRQLWQSACLDKPERPSCKVEEGNFVFTIKGNREKWGEMCKLSGVPSHAHQEISVDTLVCTWPSIADELFSMTGPLAQRKTNYEVRQQQVQMARMVQRSIEMNDVAMIEAGTGTGKGFAYLAVCMAMGKKVTVSTSNKALQAQLMHKDIPFLLDIFPGKRAVLAQGKGNYACRAKMEDLSGTIFSSQINEWHYATQSGNIEEIEFPLTFEERKSMAIDDNCPGRKLCPNGHNCFYYVAKDEREKADVIVTNHALLCINMAFAGAGILPQTDVIVVDEAHKLVDYARNTLGMELPWTAITKALDIIDGYNIDSEADPLAARFASDITRYIAQKTDPQISVRPSSEFNDGRALAEELWEAADAIWEDEVMPSSPEERRMAKDAKRVRKVGDKVNGFASATRDGFTRWIEYKDGIKLFDVPYNVAPFLKNLIGYTTEERIVDTTRCAKCNRELTAATVHVLNGIPYGPKCIDDVDVFGDAELVSLEEWLGQEHEPKVVPIGGHATIFTSATLAAPDMSMFMREVGIQGGMIMEVDSPFDYPTNAMLYVPNGASPAPNDDEYPLWCIDEIERLVEASRGSAFLLFTSYANMRSVRDALQPIFQQKYPVYVQGEGLGKLEMARRFAQDENAVLFGTKSFFEGVSIEGEALRLVVVDKMPFMAPHPITTALEADLVRYAKDELKMDGKKADWYPFEALRLPTMIIDLKQAFGRLIRTRRDYGVVAILDTRLRTSRYGRNIVLPALPDAQSAHKLLLVQDFFAQRRQPIAEPLPSLTFPKRESITVDDWTKELAF